MPNRTESLHTVDVIDLSHDGRGVADVDGQRVFVPGALPTERILLRTEKRRRRTRDGELVEILERAAARVEPPCPYFGVCGGCALQHLDYAAQIAFKQGVVAEALGRIGGVEPGQWLPTVTGPEWHYRRRARLGIKYVPAKERVLVGFRERSKPYVTDMAHCAVLVQPMDRLPQALSELVQKSPLRQRIPQAEIAVGDAGGAVILRVLDAPDAADRAAFLELGDAFDVDIYLQTGGPDSVTSLRPTPRPLYYRLAAHAVRIDFEPGDFIQINAGVNAAMVDAVIEAAAPEADDRVLDLYCGLGNFSLPIARRVAQVLGVEGVAPLVARAARNAARNGIVNARFVTADLEGTDWPFFLEPWDLVILDPARAGAASAMAAMARMRPRRVVYVSCHPGTLARDAGVLVHEQGYRLTSARVLDMFPHTHHVEAITVFDRDA
jgi:23S rRNA (uracil1939-C5)-methyltransferase